MTAPSLYTGLIERYRDRLPVSARTPVISLAEGNTPLIRLNRIAANAGVDIELYAKFEGLNPTGSFKDRGMTMAVSKAVEQGARAIICASTGNTSASAAAYAARAGITCFVLIPEGKIALGKLAQAMVHGAVVLQIDGNFDAGMRLVKEVAERAPVTIVNSINPFRLQGQKTAAFEIIEALGSAPDYHCLPVGNAGNISAYWMGYSEYHTGGVTSHRPVMAGYQASGAAPFLRGSMIDNPETVATAIRIGHPQSWDKAWQAQRESNGWFAQCSDEEILAAQRLLTRQEGIYCEPASAISISGLLNDLRARRIPDGSRVVCTLTGHGLKDPDVTIKHNTTPIMRVPAESKAVEQAILERLH
ncbi:MAG TPA: threonine synthase [Burkholderiales bacterium]